MTVFTESALVKERFEHRLEKLAQLKLRAVVVREKYAVNVDYVKTAQQVLRTFKGTETAVFVNNTDCAEELNCRNLHLAFSDFMRREINGDYRISVSVHSAEEALHAEEKGAHELVTGHIFATECKRGVTPRGLTYLSKLCAAVKIPVIAIGGINVGNYKSVLQSGAADYAIMSGAMTCDIRRLHRENK